MSNDSQRAVSDIMQNQFRLDDLLARDVVPQWFEGVAVVQLICRQLRGQGLGNSGFPRPEHIFVAVGGSVTTIGGSDEKPVESAAHVLGLMLGNDVPVRLRLSISQATAPDGGYASLAEFSEALAYFERPNPEAIVESFRQRAMSAARREVAPPVRIEASPVREKHPAPVPIAAPSRVSRLALIAATFSALACASIWLIGHRVPNGQPAIAEAIETTEPTEQPRTKDIVAASAQQRSIIASDAAATRHVDAREATPKAAFEPAPELEVSATTLSYAYPESLPAAAIALFPATTPIVFTSDDLVTVDPAEKTSDRIYSQGDPQVTVPVSVYPKLPNETPGTRAGRTILELTIAADGLVERVRMLTAPRNIHEFMLLSAAKAWRFEPARLDGRPVRFRQMLALTPMP
jgi:hypothetical protein